MDDSPVEEYRNKMTDWGLPLSQYSQQCQACFAPQSGSGLDIVENTEQGRQANQYRYPRPERRYSVFRNRGTVAPEYSDMYCTLPHLDRAETEQYVKSHMDYAECSQEIFTTKAMDEIHKASAGIPRMVNRVCEKSLMYAFQQQKRLIDDYMIKYVVEHEMLGTVTG